MVQIMNDGEYYNIEWKLPNGWEKPKARISDAQLTAEVWNDRELYWLLTFIPWNCVYMDLKFFPTHLP